jgi:hypothetical protein
MTYEWEDINGVQHVTSWSKAVWNAMLRGGAEYQVQGYWIVRELIGTRTFYYLLMLEGKASDNLPVKESKVT